MRVDWSGWDRIRARGFWRFLILRGIFGFGLMMAALLAAFQWFYRDLDMSTSRIARIASTYSERLFVGTLLALAGGVFWGVFTWVGTEWWRRRRKGRAAL